MSTNMRLLGAALVGLLAVAACQPVQPALAPSPTARPAGPSTEVEVSFRSGGDTLYGILTLPARGGPHPAIVLISGSGNSSNGQRDGASAQIHILHANRMVLDGFAVLRYDPPGVGRSTGSPAFQSLDNRAEEALAAVRYMRSRPDIRADRVGLWGVSQGGWVIGMAAAAAPQEIAFIISASGAGISVAEQQVYGVQAQTKAMGASEQDVAKAVLFARLLIDWQVTHPIYRDIDEAEAQRLGDGPWSDMARLVYGPALTPEKRLSQGIAILESIQFEPWAKALYITNLYLPALKSIPPDQLLAVNAASDKALLTDPKDYMTRVRCPVLAFFGELDENVPAKESAELFEQYLAQAGNQDVTIVMFPGVGHSLGGFMPAYWEQLSDWLKRRAG